MPSGADEVRALRDAHDRFLQSGSVGGRVRDLVADSWRRSARAGVDVEYGDLPILAGDELRDYRESHVLSHVFPLLHDVLGRAAIECDSVLAVGDEMGRLLWVSGTPTLLARAERVAFMEGAVWNESAAGTNAPGTALLLDAPVQITSAEHFRRPVQAWSCAAAPIHDPVTQRILGIVDVTGGEAIGTPQTLAMVRAAARMAEAELGRLGLAAGSGLWRPAPMTVHALGLPECQVTIDGRRVRLSPRHSEILVILADHPDGLSGDQLGIALYEEDVAASTMRAELTRLRAVLGEDVMQSRPYRLSRDVSFDWRTVSADLDAGRVREALRDYRGPLLPQSDAPGVVERRDRLAGRLRAALLASRDADLMAAWTRSRWGADDLDMWQAQLRALPVGSPLHAVAAHEVSRLDSLYGAPDLRVAPRRPTR
ncbi:GAF domain-containing protein [Nakamurella alba]|uniref:GAF domain-containing protein n=1 Tax=Nakamurella alba TaxID=2665158 RepID=UPI0018AAB0B9|nr:GAF domain-containing protein [Nakamurella alba]